MVVLPLVPLLERVKPPPPVAIAGWLLEKALVVSTRSPRPAPLWLKSTRSPAVPVNVLVWIVALRAPAAALEPIDTESLPSAVLVRPNVLVEIVSRSNEPAEFATRKLSSRPPLTWLSVTEADPVRFSNLMLESSKGVAPVVPLVPLTTLLASVNPATLVPRIP